MYQPLTMKIMMLTQTATIYATLALQKLKLVLMRVARLLRGEKMEQK
jgi:hypothetical protein